MGSLDELWGEFSTFLQDGVDAELREIFDSKIKKLFWETVEQSYREGARLDARQGGGHASGSRLRKILLKKAIEAL